jgi:hypothetical protein
MALNKIERPINVHFHNRHSGILYFFLTLGEITIG